METTDIFETEKDHIVTVTYATNRQRTGMKTLHLIIEIWEIILSGKTFEI